MARDRRIKPVTGPTLSCSRARRVPPAQKLQLFGGAIQLAGEAKARGERWRVRSDLMAVERERGISVSSAVMSFEHEVGGLTKSTTIFWYNVHMPDVRALIVAPSRSGAN